jgi:hypothetical protein
MEKALSMGQNEIRHRGVPRHLMCHARVRYGFIPINNAMTKAEPSPFDVEVMQPRTW